MENHFQPTAGRVEQHRQVGMRRRLGEQPFEVVERHVRVGGAGQQAVEQGREGVGGRAEVGGQGGPVAAAAVRVAERVDSGRVGRHHPPPYRRGRFMSRRLLRTLLAAVALAGGGCAIFENALDRQIGRAFGESEADYQRRRDDQERTASFERMGMSQQQAAELSAQARATDTAAATNSAFRLRK